MLLTSLYDINVAMDYSKAFDTVRLYTQLLSLLDALIVQCLRYQGTLKGHRSQHCIQGSGRGPATYVVNAADLRM